MNSHKQAAGWLYAYWDEDDIKYYFELDEDGTVLRQVEFAGPSRAPVTAAALVELPDAVQDGLRAVLRHEAKYGVIAESPVRDLDGFPHHNVSLDEFEARWEQARAHIEGTD